VSRTDLGFAICAGAAILPLFTGALLTAWRRWTAPRLPKPAAGSALDVTVLLPVRDEEKNVVACLERLIQLEGQPRVVVIDDGSSDGTRPLLEGLLARRVAIDVLDAPELPAGWRGKVNALHSGFRSVDSSWTLLVDADARLEPASLARAHAHAEAAGLDGVSLASRQMAGGWGEELLVPGVFGVLDALLGDWHEAARGGPCIASGQFILFRTEAFRAAGGFERIRGATIDDVALFEALRSHGSRTGFVRAPDLLAVRMYDGLAAAVTGWRRNFGAIFHRRDGVWLACLTVILAPCLALLVVAAAGVSGALASASAEVFLAGVWAFGVASSAAVRVSGDQNVLAALAWPLECCVLGWTLVLARRDRRRGRLTTWKGRTIDV
jgi:cellulose synthase/poly-beta-1,6-N-acetylglucosamine synthase-like glycosyltransferase